MSWLRLSRNRMRSCDKLLKSKKGVPGKRGRERRNGASAATDSGADRKSTRQTLKRPSRRPTSPHHRDPLVVYIDQQIVGLVLDDGLYYEAASYPHVISLGLFQTVPEAAHAVKAA